MTTETSKISDEELRTILTHINNARSEENSVNKFKYFSDALNKLWNSYFRNESSDIKKFENLLNLLKEDNINLLFSSNELKLVVNLKPLIMDHNVLRKHNYNPDNINASLRKKAQEVHKKLVARFADSMNAENSSKLNKKIAELLYIVRSNIMHGEKTPHGPDINKIERDNNVCLASYPLQELILDLLLGSPSHNLAVYGTLRQGERNHNFIEGIKGVWNDGYVKGEIEIRHNLPYFKWIVPGTDIKVNILNSIEIPIKYGDIDRFEGSDYKRILIPVISGKNRFVCNIYSIVD